MSRSAASSGKRSGSRVSRAGSGARGRGRVVEFANYTAATRWLYEHADVERVRASRVDPSTFTLERITALLERLGNPQSELRCVHIAGTNGKGSVSAMLTSSLRACGYTVGTYTSPHLVDLRERVQVNGHPVSHAACAALLGRVATAGSGLAKKLGGLTFFEIMTAVGLLHFADQAVDAAVIEVGLGGRLDATNVVVPEACVVTGISLDHERFLGETVELIAREKAGIFKPGVPVVTMPQGEKVIVETLRSVASEVGAPFQVLGKDIEFSSRFEASPQLGPHTRVGLSSERCNFEHVPVPLPGEHQAYNCGLALAAIDKLMGAGFELPEARVIEGLARTVAPGRMELVRNEPRILLDGAHNPAALSALVRSIGAHIPYDSMVMIFGCSADKNVDALLSNVALGADKVIFTRSKGNPRAADPAELNQRFSAMSSKMSQVASTLDEALSMAGRASSRDDLVCITGSFYLVGEAKKALASRAEKAGLQLSGA